jgi:hypothetical protein
MTDSFIEQLIEQGATKEAARKKTILLIVTGLLGVLTILFHPIFLLAVIVMVIVDSILFKRMNLEFEYSYFNGDLDIDKIMNRETRKRLFSVQVKEMDIVAPTGSDALRGYQQLKVLDCSSQKQDRSTYELVATYRGEKMRVRFEPNNEMLNAMRDVAPRKVIF